MQKETEFLKQDHKGDETSDRTTSENTTSFSGDSTTDVSIGDPTEEAASCKNPSEKHSENSEDSSHTADFEELIKGPYKDAFAKKVQNIINKRFKEQKIAENKSATQKHSGETPESTLNSAEEKPSSAEDGTSTYDTLIKAGVDPETAYRVLHLDEIMDSSMRYGAELAAKHLADNIRSKAARPSESALTEKGYSAKISADSLTPQKRKELARKAMMGEQIGF